MEIKSKVITHRATTTIVEVEVEKDKMVEVSVLQTDYPENGGYEIDSEIVWGDKEYNDYAEEHNKDGEITEFVENNF